MKTYLALFILCVTTAVSGCTSNSEPVAEAIPSPAATNTASPPDTAVPNPPPIPSPTPEPTSTPTAVAETATAVPTAAPVTAVAHEDGTVTLADEIIFDVQAEGIPCFPDIPAEILYAPTNAHFLVIPACIEGDNYLYLFLADGSGKQLITAEWDFVNFNNASWADDGQSFTYERINSCCLTPPDDAPPVGLVQVDVLTGEKMLIATPTPRP